MNCTSSTRTHLAWAACLGSALLGSGCSATPVPEPPAFDGSKVHSAEGIQPTTNNVALTGAPGSAEPHAIVEGFDLDGKALPVATAVAADGSFSLLLPTEGGEIRLVASVDERRSRPFDFRVMGPDLAPSPRPACLSVSPPLVAVGRPGTNVSFTFTNACTGAVTLRNARARLGSAAFSFDPQFSSTLAKGAQASFPVAIAGTAGVTDQDVVFIDVDVEGATIRYPLGVYASP